MLVAIVQEAAFCRAIPRPPWRPRNDAAEGGEGEEEDLFDVVSYVSRGKILAMPCATDTKGVRTRRQGKKKPQSLARGGAGSA